MTIDSSLRSQSTAHGRLARAREFSTQTPNTSVVAAAGPSLNPVLLSRRSGSPPRSTVILASVFGTLGCIALLVLMFLLVRWWMRRRALAEEDMVIERPSEDLQHSQEKPVFQNPPLPPPHPKPPFTPDRAYFPNHPYALSYSRNSFPPAPPPKDDSAPQTTASTLQPLTLLSPSHPYKLATPERPREPSREASGEPSTIYESFMSPDTPAATPEPGMEPSPLASTAGGATIHPQQYEAARSSEITSPSTSLSRSSSAPLRGRSYPYRS